MIPPIDPGTLINNRYLIQKILGQGGFGRTYLALDSQRFGEACVLKEFVPATTNEEVLRKSRELFEREAKVLYQIQHPQIPKFLAWLVDNQRLFIVQEYINGKTYAQILYERLSQGGKPFSETEAKTWLLDMLPVLEYIHERKIIHRDISLENVMLGSGQPKPILIDFGVVKEKMTQIFSSNSPYKQYSMNGSVVGKIGYSPTEQLRLGQCYPSSDIYALAVSVIVLLTGKMPYMLMDESLKWQWRSHVKISESLARILEKMVAELPSDRYQSAKEVLLALNSQSQTSSGSVQPKEIFDTFTASKTNQETENYLVLEELKQKVQGETATTPKSEPAISVSLSKEFLEYSQRELATIVGPFASILVKQALTKTPQIAPNEFIETLTAAIPDKEKAQEFRTRIQKSFQKTKIHDASYTAISNPEFLQNCRRELTSFVGPFASVILEDTLRQHPNYTPQQLVESLVAEIPNPQRAQQFKERIEKLNM